MNRIPLPPKPEQVDIDAASEVLAITHAHFLIEDAFEMADNRGVTEEDIFESVLGCDSRGNERDEDDLDVVETEAYKMACLHFGVESRLL